MSVDSEKKEAKPSFETILKYELEQSVQIEIQSATPTKSEIKHQIRLLKAERQLLYFRWIRFPNLRTNIEFFIRQIAEEIQFLKEEQLRMISND